MGSFSIVHWIIFAIVVIAIFGTSKLKNAGKDLGGAVKGFKDAVRDENESHAQNRVIDHQSQTEVKTTQTEKSNQS